MCCKNACLLKGLIWLAVLLATVSCGTKQVVTDTSMPSGSPTKTDAEKMSVFNKVRANEANLSNLSSKIKFTISSGSKDFSVSGSLKMRRDEVIRIQLVPLGLMEAGRLEFSKDNVLLMDRMNKEYVQASYSDVDFLRNNGLDFYALQALFWNEIFLPGTQNAEAALPHFDVETAKNQTLLRAEGAGRLAYTFHTQTSNARVARVEVQPQPTGSAAQGTFVWTYDKFGQVAGSLFPAQMACSVTLGSKQAGFNLALSHFDTEDGWDAHTSVSSKYKEQNANALFRQILGM